VASLVISSGTLRAFSLQDKDHFADLAVDAVLRLKGSQNLESIHIIKKPGGTLRVRCHANRPKLLLSAVP
jgi:chaperonin GroEL (HSP60 family)